MRNRLNAISGDTVALNTTFFQGGLAKDPYAIRAVRIYRQSVRPDNLVLEVVFPTPVETGSVYPLPMTRVADPNSTGQNLPGAFVLPLDLPITTFKTGMYFDVWNYIGDEADLNATSPDFNDESIWQSSCNKFFVTEGGWFVDDNLSSIRLGFEPLDTRFQQPEKRMLEVGMMPLPIYDFDYKKIMPILPFLEGTIHIETQSCEVLVASEPMTIGERAGSYRSNPFVLRWLFDTSRFLKGTYRYRVDVTLPNGETRSSPFFNIAVR